MYRDKKVTVLRCVTAVAETHRHTRRHFEAFAFPIVSLLALNRAP